MRASHVRKTCFNEFYRGQTYKVNTFPNALMNTRGELWISQGVGGIFDIPNFCQMPNVRIWPSTATRENTLPCQSVTLNETSKSRVSRSSEVLGGWKISPFVQNLQNVTQREIANLANFRIRQRWAAPTPSVPWVTCFFPELEKLDLYTLNASRN